MLNELVKAAQVIQGWQRRETPLLGHPGSPLPCVLVASLLEVPTSFLREAGVEEKKMETVEQQTSI